MHGIYYSSNTLLHNTILGPDQYLHVGNQKGYKFVWSIYNEIAERINIKLPTSWYAAKLYLKSNRKHIKASGNYLLEPLGPTFFADSNYDFNKFFTKHANHNVYTDVNWRARAESFFMQSQSAKVMMVQANTEVLDPMIYCKRWRIIKIR